MKKLLASSMGNNEKVNSNKLFCTLKISKGLIEYVQKKNKIFFVPVLTDAGFPIWWYVAPTIINTFLEAYDFSGKKIVLFATSGGSGFGNTVKELQPSAPDAVITEGRLLNCGTKQEISEWVNSL